MRLSFHQGVRAGAGLWNTFDLTATTHCMHSADCPLDRNSASPYPRRPVVEAMAMGLPTIATNWSGTSSFLSNEHAYPLPFTLVPVGGDGAIAEQKWAQPSAGALRSLMRRVFSHPSEAKEKGARARQLVAKRYSQAAVADLLIDRCACLMNSALTLSFTPNIPSTHDLAIVMSRSFLQRWHAVMPSV